MSLISLTDVEFTYAQQAKPVLKIAHFAIQKSERVFVYGPSGSGKSTFLEILAGVLVAQKGNVTLLGQNLTELTATARDAFRANHMGYVFQSFNLIPYLNVRENIEMPIHLSRLRRERMKNQNLHSEVLSLTQALGIGEFMERRVTELSIGQQQRVAVARALIGKPEIILADEPTSSLDYDHRERFIKTLFQVSEEVGSTVVFVSHDRTLEKLFSRAVAFDQVNQVGS